MVPGSLSLRLPGMTRRKRRWQCHWQQGTGSLPVGPATYGPGPARRLNVRVAAAAGGGLASRAAAGDSLADSESVTRPTQCKCKWQWQSGVANGTHGS